jgi:hypothetical protein
MKKLVIVTVFVEIYAMENVETISYESKEKFLSDVKEWQNCPGDSFDRFLNTTIYHRYVNDLSEYDNGAYDVYTLEEFFEARKVN